MPRIIVMGDGSSVADANAGFPCSAAEQDANARLIAAAPDLLAACRSAIAGLAGVEAGMGMKVGTLLDLPAMATISAAIAKAEGGAQ